MPARNCRSISAKNYTRYTDGERLSGLSFLHDESG
nr:MAG TPA: hypothetical protein [Bacteriophage sp.]